MKLQLDALFPVSTTVSTDLADPEALAGPSVLCPMLRLQAGNNSRAAIAKVVLIAETM
jgi:hypothetical protein